MGTAWRCATVGMFPGRACFHVSTPESFGRWPPEAVTWSGASALLCALRRAPLPRRCAAVSFRNQTMPTAGLHRDNVPKSMHFALASTCVLSNDSYAWVCGGSSVTNQFRKGEVVRAFVQGEHRELVVDKIASDGSVAQCYWTQGGSKHFVMVFAGAAQKVATGPVPVREH